jgi:hypothetical protein
MPNNGSMAIWFRPRAGSAATEAEVHFNYWRIAGDKSFSKKRADRGAVQDFIEIGTLVTDINQIDSICVYIPAIIKRKDVKDCAPYLAEAEFAQGIFNEVLSVTASAAGGPHCIILHDENAQVFARVHRFNQGSMIVDPGELSIVESHDGTILTITAAAIQEARNHANPLARVYFRLRVNLEESNEANPFVKVIQPHDRMFQSGFDEIEYIDFRMNEARTLPAPIEQRMRNDRTGGGAVSFKLVAFLTAVPVHSELSVANTPSHKMRLLETNWNNYAPSGIPDGMVVYHWKREAQPNAPITDFSAFVKLQTRRSSRKILVIYLAIAFVFGLAGNLAASGLQEGWSALWPEPVAIASRPRSLPPPTKNDAPPKPAPAIRDAPNTVGNTL